MNKKLDFVRNYAKVMKQLELENKKCLSNTHRVMRLKKVIPHMNQDLNKKVESSKYGVASVERLCYGLKEIRNSTSLSVVDA